MNGKIKSSKRKQRGGKHPLNYFRLTCKATPRRNKTSNAKCKANIP